MATQQEVFAIIKSFADKESVIAVPRVFFHMFQSAETGIFLGQLLYWSDKSTCNKPGYFYKTQKEWTEETNLSDHAIRKARKQLVDAGILETRVWRAKGSPTVHFRLLKDNLVTAVLAHLATEKQEAADKEAEESDSILPEQQIDLLPATNPIVASNESITEITSKNTSKEEATALSLPEPPPLPEAIIPIEGPPVPEPAPGGNGPIVERELTPHQIYFGALADALDIPIDVASKAQKGRLNKFSKRVRDGGFTLEDVRKATLLWGSTWPGETGSPPNDDQFVQRLETTRKAREKRERKYA